MKADPDFLPARDAISLAVKRLPIQVVCNHDLGADDDREVDAWIIAHGLQPIDHWDYGTSRQLVDLYGEINKPGRVWYYFDEVNMKDQWHFHKEDSGIAALFRLAWG